MTNKLEQDKQIIADAPKLAVGVDRYGDYMFHGNYMFHGKGIRSLDDIRENIALQERIAELEQENATLKHVEQIFNDSPDLTFETVQRLFEDELAKRDLEQQAKGLDNFKIPDLRYIDYHGVGDALMEQAKQLREQAKGGDS